VNGGASDDPRQLAALRGSARHRRQGAGLTQGADVNMALMRRLAEGAAASGDVRSAAEAVRVCMAEAETLYQLALSEREQAQAMARQAAEDQARARLLHEEAARAFDEARTRRERLAPGPSQDAPGLRLRPDPGSVRTPAELIDALRQFRTWAGNPSFRDMARACNGRPAASTMCKVLAAGTLPVRFEVIDAIITACGGEEEDRERFWTAWRRLMMTPGEQGRSITGRVRTFPGPRRSARPARAVPDVSPA
jgi:hypothetical protein